MDLSASPHIAAAGALVDGAHLLIAMPDAPPLGFVIYAGGVLLGLAIIAYARLARPYLHRPHDPEFDLVRRSFHHGDIDLAEAERRRKALKGD